MGRPQKMALREENSLQRMSIKDQFEIAGSLALQVDKDININVSRQIVSGHWRGIILVLFTEVRYLRALIRYGL